MKRIGFIFLCVQICAAWTWAAADVPAAWRTVFEKMDSWGLPDVSAAQFVLIEDDMEFRFEGIKPGYSHRNAPAWLFPANTDADGHVHPAKIIVDGSRIIRVYPKDESPFSKSAKRKDIPNIVPTKTYLCSTWEAADPLKELTRAAGLLQDFRFYDRKELIHGQTDSTARILLLAYQLWRQGKTEGLADVFAELSIWQEKNDVGNAALNLVADGAYDTALRAYYDTGDRAAFLKELEHVLGMYGKQWRLAPAVELLRERMSAQLNPDELPIIATKVLSPEEGEWARQMLVTRETHRDKFYFSHPVVWMLPSLWEDFPPEVPDVEWNVMKQGIHAIPFLLSLLDDEQLTTLDYGRVKERRYADSISWVRLSEKKGKTETKWIYQSLARPATRGELAEAWLLRLLPEKVAGKSLDRDIGNLKSMAASFYEQYADQPMDAWIPMLITDDRYRYSVSIVDIILSWAAAQRQPALEEWIWEGGDIWKEPHRDKLDVLLKYARLRGAEALPMIQAAYDSVPDEELPNDYQRQQRDARVRMLSNFLATPFLTDESCSPSEIVKTIQHEESALWQTAPFQCLLDAVLMYAAGEENTDDAIDVIHHLSQDAFAKYGTPMNLAGNLELWSRLIADDRTDSRGRVLSEVVLVLNEQLFADSSQYTGEYNKWSYPNPSAQRAAGLLQQYGRDARYWLQERVRLRLDGVPETELPHYEDIPELAKDESLVAGVETALSGAVSSEQLQSALMDWRPEERMVLPELLCKNPKLNAALYACANHLGSMQLDALPDMWRDRLQKWAGKAPDAALLQELRACMEYLARNGLHVRMDLVYQQNFEGWSLSATSIPLREGFAVDGYGGIVLGDNLYAEAFWPLGNTDISGAAPFYHERFNNAMSDFLNEAQLASCRKSVYLQTRGWKHEVWDD